MTSADDSTRFRALFAAHRSDVLRYARRRVSADAAADVVADTFLVAWRRLDSVPDDPLPWLYGVARRVIANQRRSERRALALSGRLAGETPAVMAAPQDGVADADALRAALSTLSERDREALRLVAWEGLDTARAAHAAGCSRAAFAVRLHRARRRLVAALAEDAPPVLIKEVPREA